MDKRRVGSLICIQVKPFAVGAALEAVGAVCLLVDIILLRILTVFFLELCILMRAGRCLTDHILWMRCRGDVIQAAASGIRCRAQVNIIRTASRHDICFLVLSDEIHHIAIGVFQLEHRAGQRLAVLIELLERQSDAADRVGEHDRALNVLNDGAGGRTAGGDHAVDRIRDGIARGVQLLDGVAQADGEIFDVDGLAVLQREFAALVEDQIVGGAAAAVGLGVGVVVEDLVSVCIGEVDLKAELLRRVRFADDFLFHRQITGFLLDVDAGDGRKREAHVAGGAGSAALGVEEGERVLACPPLLQIVPQVDILADGGVNAADVADELVIQEHPHVVVAEEVILQRADIILRQREFHSVLHTEEGVVRNAVIAVWETTN